MLSWSGSGTSGEPTARGVCGVSTWCLEECPRRTCCGRRRTHRLRDTTVPVQDGTGMEICNANCACANHWIIHVSQCTIDLARIYCRSLIICCKFVVMVLSAVNS